MTTDARLDEIDRHTNPQVHPFARQSWMEAHGVTAVRELLAEVRRLREIERIARILIDGRDGGLIWNRDADRLEQALAPERTAPNE